MNIHNSVNQKILGDLVGREVKECQSSLVDMLLSNNIEDFEYDNINNYYQLVCPECGEKMLDLSTDNPKDEKRFYAP